MSSTPTPLASPLGTITYEGMWSTIFAPFTPFTANNGLRGLAKVDGDTLTLLAVDAHPPKQGQFREFIAQCQGVYRTIRILEIWNPWLPEVLKRYGFAPWEGDVDGDAVVGMQWSRRE